MTTLVPEIVGDTQDTLRLEHSPEPVASAGAGISYPVIPAGIALQLGALGIVLALLSAAYAHLFDVAAAGIVVPVAFSVGAVAIFVRRPHQLPRRDPRRRGHRLPLRSLLALHRPAAAVSTRGALVSAVGAKSFGDALGTYFLIWGIMSLGLCIPVWFVSKVVFTQQLLLALVFFVLAAGQYSTVHSAGIIQVGGFMGLVDAAICYYISMSLISNETAGKTILPLP